MMEDDSGFVVSNKHATDRFRKGLCPTCGIQTHKVERAAFFSKKRTPLTMEGQVLNGTCLVCNPVDPFFAGPMHRRMQKSPTSAPRRAMSVASAVSASGIPTVLEVCNRDEEISVVSGITMDHRLTDGDRICQDGNGDDNYFKVEPGQVRPRQNFGEIDYDAPPTQPKRIHNTKLKTSREDTNRSAPERIQRRRSSSDQSFLNKLYTGSIQNMDSVESHKDNSLNPNLSSGRSSNAKKSSGIPHIYGPKHSDSKTNVFTIQEEQCGDSESSSLIRNRKSQMKASDSKEETKLEIMAHVSTPDSKPINISSLSDGSERKIPFRGRSCVNSTLSKKAAVPLSDCGRITPLKEIPTLLQDLNSGKAGRREAAFQELTKIVWESGQEAKTLIARHNGVASITKSMWASMAETPAQEASAQLLLSLSASSDGDAANDILVGPSAEVTIDALLITMQSRLSVENIQYAGCGTLSCLAAASSNNPEINDGTFAGAVLAVMNAMDAHTTSKRVQEWGLRALFNQCVHSKNAESNMRNLAKKAGLNHKSGCAGPEVIYRALENPQNDIIAEELACRLYWRLSSSEDVAALLCETPKPFQEVLLVIQRYDHKKELDNISLAGLLEAAFGALGNFINLKQNQCFMQDCVSIISTAVRVLGNASNSIGLCIEACALIANFAAVSKSASPEYQELFAQIDSIVVIKAILAALEIFSNSEALYEESIRAIVCLSIDFDQVKTFLSSKTILSLLLRLSKRHMKCITGQISLCNLSSSFFVRKEGKVLARNFLCNSGLDLIITAMKANPKVQKVQEAACLTIRNIICYQREQVLESLIIGEPLKLLIEAATEHENSEIIQLNVCCVLWNIADVSKEKVDFILDEKIVEYLIRTMQTHLESGSVLEMACGALWCLADASEEHRKRILKSDGAIDAVTCVIVMHPNEERTLEKAFGVLSSVSICPTNANAIADAQGVGNIVEAMQSNSTSIVLLEFGAIVLRNIILTRSNYATEASNVLPSLINQMKQNYDAIGFQREACSLLWAMAASSEQWKEKILSLDGFSVIVKCIEVYSSFPDTQEVAMGAFSQLTR